MKRIKSNKKNFKFIVVGDDFASIKVMDYLRKQFDDDSVVLFSYCALKKKHLLFNGPSLVRGPENMACMKKILDRNGIEFESELKKSLYYKDQKFYSFNKKKKLGDFKSYENFFVQESIECPVEKLFPENIDQLIEDVNFNRIDKEIISIDKMKADENRGNEQYRWKIECSDGNIYKCEHLYWGNGAEIFYKTLKEKTNFSDKFGEFCLTMKRTPSLLMTFMFKEAVTDKKETLIIPQSFTHDWGHFIGEFGVDKVDGHQAFSFFTYVNDDEITDELISKKVSLMKRVLERVFPKAKETTVNDEILVLENSPNTLTNDEYFENIDDDLSDLTFIGINAPISKVIFDKYELDQEKRLNINNICRSYLSVEEAVSKLN